MPINRYRPNILLTTADTESESGSLVGFEEDRWKHLEFFPISNQNEPIPFGREAEGKGQGVFCLARCGRCGVPGIDLNTGVRDGILPARVLQRYRTIDPNQPYSPCFGVLSTPREKGTPTFSFQFFLVTLLMFNAVFSWYLASGRYSACDAYRSTSNPQEV